MKPRTLLLKEILLPNQGCSFCNGTGLVCGSCGNWHPALNKLNAVRCRCTSNNVSMDGIRRALDTIEGYFFQVAHLVVQDKHWKRFMES